MTYRYIAALYPDLNRGEKPNRLIIQGAANEDALASVEQVGYERPNENGDAQPYETGITGAQIFAAQNYCNDDVQGKSQSPEDHGRTHAVIVTRSAGDIAVMTAGEL